jgi:hypothetical protein
MASSAAINPDGAFPPSGPGELEPGNALAAWGSRTSRSTPVHTKYQSAENIANRKACCAEMDLLREVLPPERVSADPEGNRPGLVRGYLDRLVENRKPRRTTDSL